MKILPPITKTQKQILLFLLKFRFTTVSQLQKYLNHKNHHRINNWLTNLKDKKYICVIKDSKDITKPYIYCLNTQARYLLKEIGVENEIFLNRLYKEKSLTSLFKNHCLFLVEVYLFFLTHKENDSKLVFCTPQDLVGFEYLPEELDAYIAVVTNTGTKRYFLELFDEYKNSAGKARFAVRKYISYCEDGAWQANTNNSPLPSVLLILPDERRRKHINFYSKAKLGKTFEEVSLYLTTQDIIRFSKTTQNIWQKVELT